MKQDSESNLGAARQLSANRGSRARTPGFTAEAGVYRSCHDYRAIAAAPQPGQHPLGRLTLTLTDYNSRWPLLFQLERRRIDAILGSLVISIEHVGSSSVPYLGGRSEIDILVGVRAASDVEKCARLLAELGYITTAHPLSPSDGWWLMTRPGHIPFELLLAPHLSPLWKRHLWFRDHLRRNPTTALAYRRLKLEWANKYGANTTAYKEAKKQFVTSIEKMARLENSS